MLPEHRELPGQPKPKLVKAVRAYLRHRGICPKHRYATPWLAAWQWAHAIAISYFHNVWPSSEQIGTLYLILLMSQMDADNDLSLPLRAAKKLPDEIRRAFQLVRPTELPTLTTSPWSRRRQPKPADPQLFPESDPNA